MRFLSLRQILLAGFLVALLSGCGGSKKVEAGDSKDRSPPAADNDRGTLSREDLISCAIFEKAVEWALDHHVTRTQSEKGTLLASSYDSLRTAIVSLAESTEKAAVQAEINKVPAPTDEDFNKCTAYIRLLPGISKTAVVRVMSEQTRTPLLAIVLREALFRFAKALDLNSSYHDPWDTAAKESETVVGAGLSLLDRTDYDMGRKPPYLVVTGAFAGSANRSILGAEGSMPVGSRIHEIEEKSVSSLSYAEAVERINYFNSVEGKLENGSPVPATVRVGIERWDPKERKFAAKRSLVSLKTGLFTPSLALLDYPDGESSGIARIRVLNFLERSSVNFMEQWANDLQERLSNGRKPARGIILDLRGNVGGYLQESLWILNRLLPYNSPTQQSASTREQNGKKEMVFPAAVQLTTTNALSIQVEPMVVLVDRHSISAAEIVAAALKDYRRGVILGESTFGKGVGQQVLRNLPQPIGGTLQVTSFYWFSPEGKSYQRTGVPPDLPIEDPVNQWQYKKSERPARMADYLTSEATRSLVIPTPIDLPGLAPGFDPPEAPAQITTGLETLRSLPACRLDPDSKDFSEETDCLLQAGLEQLKKMIAQP